MVLGKYLGSTAEEYLERSTVDEYWWDIVGVMGKYCEGWDIVGVLGQQELGRTGEVPAGALWGGTWMVLGVFFAFLWMYLGSTWMVLGVFFAFAQYEAPGVNFAARWPPSARAPKFGRSPGSPGLGPQPLECAALHSRFQ